ncbi:MAG: GNAT family N-acetyltransferase [Candidatus Zixiibacteriota bacterium]
MYWRLRNADFDEQKGDRNRAQMKSLVLKNSVPGILAYHKSQPVGWCAVGPRDDYIRFETSRILKPVDDRKVWSIVCLFIDKNYRRKGVSARLLKAAVEHAARRGATIIEGYPFEPKKKDMPDPFVWTGLASAYLEQDFVEVARRSPTRPIMRYFVKP